MIVVSFIWPLLCFTKFTYKVANLNISLFIFWPQMLPFSLSLIILKKKQKNLTVKASAQHPAINMTVKCATVTSYYIISSVRERIINQGTVGVVEVNHLSAPPVRLNTTMCLMQGHHVGCHIVLTVTRAFTLY